MAASRTIIVAGAGIGGLTASLALAKQGFRVVLLETFGLLQNDDAKALRGQRQRRRQSSDAGTGDEDRA